MADRYWVGDGGNWSDNTNHWAASSGGAANETKPTSSDNVFFDANSFTAGSQTVVADEIASFLDMDWTGATNTPTMNAGNRFQAFGDVTFISAMVTSGDTDFYFRNSSGTKTLTTNGLSLSMSPRRNDAGGTTKLLDALTSARAIEIIAGTLDTNGQTVTAVSIDDLVQAGTKVITLGSSTINLSGGAGWDLTGTNNTVNAGTSTIKVAGTGAFNGNGKTYNNVELNGTAHTIAGSNTFNSLKIGRSAAVTITGTAGTTQIVRHFFATDSANVLTMDSTGASWTITGNVGYCELDYTDLTNVVAGYKNIYYAGDNSTDGTGNTDWIFSRKVRPSNIP